MLMTKINYNFSEEPADVAELFCTLGVLQVVLVMNKKERDTQVCLSGFYLSGQLSFQKTNHL